MHFESLFAQLGLKRMTEGGGNREYKGNNLSKGRGPSAPGPQKGGFCTGPRWRAQGSRGAAEKGFAGEKLKLRYVR